MAASEAFNALYKKNKQPPSAASALARMNAIGADDDTNDAKKEAVLIELDRILGSMSSVKDEGHFCCYYVATA